MNIENNFFRELLQHVEVKKSKRPFVRKNKQPAINGSSLDQALGLIENSPPEFYHVLNESWAIAHLPELFLANFQMSLCRASTGNFNVRFSGCNDEESLLITRILASLTDSHMISIAGMICKIEDGEFHFPDKVEVPVAYLNVLDMFIRFDTWQAIQDAQLVGVNIIPDIISAIKSSEAKEKAEIRHNQTTRPLKAKAIELAEEIRTANPSQSLRSISKQLHPKLKQYAKSEGLPYSTDDPYGTLYKWLREHFKA